MEELAVRIAGVGADGVMLDRARRVAEAQLDLLRVRRARLKLLSDPEERVHSVRIADLLRAIKEAETRGLVDEISHDLNERQGARPLTLEEGLPVLAQKLIRLDRYERRALSRRKRAIQWFDGLALDHTPATV